MRLRPSAHLISVVVFIVYLNIFKSANFYGIFTVWQILPTVIISVPLSFQFDNGIVLRVFDANPKALRVIVSETVVIPHNGVFTVYFGTPDCFIWRLTKRHRIDLFVVAAVFVNNVQFDLIVLGRKIFKTSNIASVLLRIFLGFYTLITFINLIAIYQNIYPICIGVINSVPLYISTVYSYCFRHNNRFVRLYRIGRLYFLAPVIIVVNVVFASMNKNLIFRIGEK